MYILLSSQLIPYGAKENLRFVLGRRILMQNKSIKKVNQQKEILMMEKKTL